MNAIIEQAKALRAQMEALAQYAPEAEAVKAKSLYPMWSGDSVPYYDGTGAQPQSKVRGKTYPDRLYKCLQGHESQPSWEPDLTPALWVVIDETHAGTVEDPIPAARGMEYTEGLYYLDPEDGKTYLCTRSAVLQYLPHELIGQYFTEATA